MGHYLLIILLNSFIKVRTIYLYKTKLKIQFIQDPTSNVERHIPQVHRELQAKSYHLVEKKEKLTEESHRAERHDRPWYLHGDLWQEEAKAFWAELWS